MVEKQASSEIAQSRERFEKWLKGEPMEVKTLNRTNGHYVVFDIEKMWNSYQQAERDTRERCAQICDERIAYWKARLVSHTAVERISVERLIAEFTELAERIRGKE